MYCKRKKRSFNCISQYVYNVEHINPVLMDSHIIHLDISLFPGARSGILERGADEYNFLNQEVVLSRSFLKKSLRN